MAGPVWPVTEGGAFRRVRGGGMAGAPRGAPDSIASSRDQNERFRELTCHRLANGTGHADRDRRHHVLQAEYDSRTGVQHLEEKVTDMQAQLRRTTAERDKWQESYLALTGQVWRRPAAAATGSSRTTSPARR